MSSSSQSAHSQGVPRGHHRDAITTSLKPRQVSCSKEALPFFPRAAGKFVGGAGAEALAGSHPWALCQSDDDCCCFEHLPGQGGRFGYGLKVTQDGVGEGNVKMFCQKLFRQGD